ncbi:MAG: protein kinase, partial [Acidobacteria bacterium]|nr:protein kinase [Acidobacteriota bacterium]
AAQAFERAGDWVRAGTQWEAAKDHLHAADAYRKAGRLSVAARCMADAGELSEAARMYEDAGDLSGAATCHAKAGRGLQAAQLFFKAGRVGAATRALSTVRPNTPQFGGAAALMARSLVENEKYAEALEAIRRVPPEQRERGPVAAECLYWGGRAFEALGQAPQARACYQKLIFMPEDHRDAASRLAELEVALGATLVSASPASEPPPLPGGELPPGYVLADRYEIEEELGKGGMGRVYRAFDRELQEKVAIKTLLEMVQAGSEEEARFIREVQICRRITHPNIVRIYDLGRFNGGLFVTMELLEGTPVDTLLTRQRQLPFSQVKGVLAQVLAGLAEAHGQGVVHRDLKPGNLFLADQRIKILDFGIARMSSLDGKLTQTGTTLGSPLYMSPEQLQGIELDGRSDLYSLGTLAYTLIAGREPFAGRAVSAIFMAQMNEPPPDIRSFRSDTPPAWMEFLGRLLAKDREQRYASAQQVAQVLPGLPQ